MNALAEQLRSRRERVDRALDSYLPPVSAEPRLVHECMRYAAEGGKRLRPIVALAVGDALDCPESRLLPTCVAIELIHTHSLILDDLPCMDGDDLRRGRPTCHIRFGESVALLAADALLNLAIYLLASNDRLADVPAETALRVIREVGECVGTGGVIGGQAADLSYDPFATTGAVLEKIHLAKTGLLFRLATRSAAIVAGAGQEQLEAASSYGERLGLAFQIVDDMLDAPGNGGGAGGRRPAEPNLATSQGMASASSLAARVTDEALAALSGLGPRVDPLRQLALFNLRRSG